MIIYSIHIEHLTKEGIRLSKDNFYLNKSKRDKDYKKTAKSEDVYICYAETLEVNEEK